MLRAVKQVGQRHPDSVQHSFHGVLPLLRKCNHGGYGGRIRRITLIAIGLQWPWKTTWDFEGPQKSLNQRELLSRSGCMVNSSVVDELASSQSDPAQGEGDPAALPFGGHMKSEITSLHRFRDTGGNGLPFQGTGPAFGSAQ